jgi:DtxR family Mn-dependent transcriptional regulator
MPSQIKENYLKSIYFLSTKEKPISITELAKNMNVSKPTSNNMVKKLQELGWIKYEKYKPIKLTLKGKNIATSIVRKHRLTEMFLTQVMGFGWEEVHDIAEEIEHLKSDLFFDRMDEILGFPTTDPHGSPIPDKQGNIIKTKRFNFSKIKPDEIVELCGFTNNSNDLLVYLNKKKIQLGTTLKIKHIEVFDNSYEIIVNNNHKQPITLSKEVCDLLLVSKKSN